MTTLRVHSSREAWHAIPHVSTMQIVAEIAVVFTNILLLTALLHHPISTVFGAEIPDPLLFAMIGIAITTIIGLMTYTVKLVVELAVEVKEITRRIDDHESRVRSIESDVGRDPASRTRRGDHIPRR